MAEARGSLLLKGNVILYIILCLKHIINLEISGGNNMSSVNRRLFF